MFLVHRWDVAPQGHVPTVLSGYGGFSVARTPAYNAGVSRVDPMHARKMAALLQSFQDEPPVLLRVDRDAGHGVGKPLHLQLDDLADLWSFFAWRLGGEDGMLALR